MIDNSLQVLGFNSIDKYYSSDLFRMVKQVVLQRDKGKCQFKTCSGENSKATEVVFLHKILPAYLGIGCFNLFSVCAECAGLNLSGPSLIFALTGVRTRRGQSRPEIGEWYKRNFKRNQGPARAIFKRLNSRLKVLTIQLLANEELGKSYWEYLGLRKPEYVKSTK